MKPYLAQYNDTIQVEANSYLCFPTAPEKERKEDKWKKINEGMWVKICFCIKMNLSAKPSNIDYDFFNLPFLCSQIM